MVDSNGKESGVILTRTVKPKQAKMFPRLLTTKKAEQYLGSRAALDDLLRAGWVAPIRKTATRTHYDRNALDRAVDRAHLEQWPSASGTVD